MTTLTSVTLSNQQGMTVEIINFGARLKSIKFPVRGKLTEMILGHEKPEHYLTDTFYLGATCGRVCNRIENAAFAIADVQYQLSQNEGEHCLHGGMDNFSYRYWRIVAYSSTSVTLSLYSKDSDQGFPGNVEVFVNYQLTNNNEIIIDYKATTDAKTPINLTNHSYFSLGESSGELLNLSMSASKVLERKENGLPSGKLLAVAATDFDFRTFVNIAQRQQKCTDAALRNMKGFDHCFVLDSNNINHASAVLISEKNKVKMTLFTNQNAIQFYAGAYLAEKFSPYQGICLEAQNYSNAINIKHFPERVLLPQDTYQKRIIFHFETFKGYLATKSLT